MAHITTDQGYNIIGCLQTGQSQSAAAWQFNVLISTISHICRRVEETGSLAEPSCSGKPRVTTPADNLFIRLHHLRNWLASASQTMLRNAWNRELVLSILVKYNEPRDCTENYSQQHERPAGDAYFITWIKKGETTWSADFLGRATTAWWHFFLLRSQYCRCLISSASRPPGILLESRDSLKPEFPCAKTFGIQ